MPASRTTQFCPADTAMGWMRVCLPFVAAIGLAALSGVTTASAVTVDNGIVLITQADALAGNVTPGDTAGFPITLSVSGSYRLASNLAISSTVNGINVTAPDVTIDFAGFRMAGSGLGLFGIFGSFRALTVKNGTIRGFAQDAIVGSSGLTVDRMRIVDNPNTRTFGAAVTAADNAVIRDSNLSRNGFNKAGVICGLRCRVEMNIIAGEGGTQVAISVAGGDGFVIGNTVAGFASPIGTDSQVTIGDNTFVGNTGASFGTILPLDPNQPVPPP